MLRILFFILAVVAAVLAVVLEQPLYYAAAGALLVLTGILMVFQLRRNHKKAQESYMRPSPSSHDEELKDLGIMAIRPKSKSQIGAGITTEEEPVAETAGSGEAPLPKSSGSVVGASQPRLRKKDLPVNVDEENSLARQKKDVIMPYLHSLLTAVNANTVCLLRKDEAATRYHIEAIISRNSYARSQGQFVAKEPLMIPAEPMKPVTVLRVGEKGISPQHLGYYLEPISARQVALAVVPPVSSRESYVLLVDTMEEGGLGSQKQISLLTQFAGLLASVLETQEAEEETPAVEPAQEVKPRREIIAEEMSRARSTKSSLAFALVHLRQAEALAESGSDHVEEAEAMLEHHILDSVGDSRVERFGELTYGVFHHRTIGDVEDWAMQLQREMDQEDGLLAGGVSIGIAVLSERHESPEDLRADATEALRESFETGNCTIIE